MKTRIKRVENVCLMAESESGHTVIIDGSPEIGGRNLGVRPMELILMGLGGCTTMDVLSILSKQRQEVTDCVIQVNAERREAVPKIFSEIHIHFVVTGRNLSESLVKRAVDLSAEKYCSVSAMLQATVKITYSFDIVESTP
ncbi:OsmC family protein [Thioflexithrix psekupsensis]|uniref:Peroxiredoxin n=1 Tax=Thioflexithrix psekupsensis TaxID=1570016 RepID=A0A251X9R4_9GAMM|nr:OsmC family protein [Thioflexithrix psekupsensis]OUD15043.1 peroxiredoxin [Thioflexithrix psekupsensis]